MVYKYSKIDRIENPNTYFYTQFQGANFLQAFQGSRSKILDLGIKPFEVEFGSINPENCQPEFIETSVILGQMYRKLKKDNNDSRVTGFEDIDLMLRKFEVSKMIYESYSKGFKNKPGSNPRVFLNYVKFASILHYAYLSTKKLNYLNGILKILDTLISVFIELSDEEKCNLCWLIERENDHIESLQAQLGVNI